MAYLLESEYGLALPRRLQIEFSQVVQRVMDTEGKELTAADLWRIFQREYRMETGHGLRRHVVQAHDGGIVSLRGDLSWNGQVHAIEGRGNGPIDAFSRALGQAAGHAIRVVDYQQHAIGSGADARAVAYVELRVDGSQALFGVGIDADTTAAAFKAIASGVHRAAPAGTAQSRSVTDAVAA